MNWKLLIWAVSVAANFVLDPDNGIVCSMVKKTASAASILLEFTKYVGGNGDIGNLRFPTFILYYPDLAHITKIPNRNRYGAIYKDRKNLIDYLTEDSKFDVTIDKGFEKNVYNHFLIPGKPGDALTFNVPKSGLYCVYIAPSDLIKDFEIEVTFENSYGLLSFHRYVNIYLEMIILTFAIGLYGYITSVVFKRDGKFDRASLVALFVMFSILIPVIVITSLSFVIDLVSNIFKLDAFIYQILLEVRYFLNAVFEVGFKAMILILAMGEGAVYFPKNPLPNNLRNYTIYLSLINLCLNLLSFTVNPSHTHDSVFRSYELYSQDTQSTFAFILEYTLLAFPYIWFISTLYFYFKTLTKFTGENRLEIRNNQIYQAFRKSGSFFVLAPFISDFIDMLIYWYQTFSLYEYQYIPIDDENGDGLSIVQSLMAEAVDLSFNWSTLVQTITFIVTLMLIFYIWIRNNIGLDDAEYKKIAHSISREEGFTQDSIKLQNL